MIKYATTCAVTVMALIFSTHLHAQTQPVDSNPGSTTTQTQQTPDEADVYEIASGVKLSTATLTALHRIHLSREDRALLDELAGSAGKSNQEMVKKSNPSPSDLTEARGLAEDVCREFAKVLTGKLRGIETGTTGWELLSSLATGVGIGTTVIGSARVAALVAGGSTAWGKTYGKPDTEHGADALRQARTALSDIRLEFGRRLDGLNDKWLEAPAKDKTKFKKIFSAVTAGFINTYKG